MVLTRDALADRTDEESRQDHSGSPRSHPQLLSCPERVLQRCHRGSEQQSQSHHEKILWVPDLPRNRTGPLSFTWQAARTGTHPQILLTNPFLLSASRAGARGRPSREYYWRSWSCMARLLPLVEIG